MLLMRQVLNMVETVYRPAEGVDLYQAAGSKDGLRRMAEEFDRLGVRWDARRMVYTFSDGATLTGRGGE